MKPAYTEKLLARHVRFLNPDLIEIHRPMMQIWRLIIIVIGLLLAFIGWVKHADTIYTRDDTFVTYVKWFIQPSTEKHKADLQYAEEQIKENQALEAQLKELAKVLFNLSTNTIHLTKGILLKSNVRLPLVLLVSHLLHSLLAYFYLTNDLFALIDVVA